MNTKTKDVVHIAIAGHVDHGKSTLIGRLLYDTDSLLQGKAESIRQACERSGKPFDYSFLLDAFEEERSQSVTIDTTQVRFATPEKEYVIIDAPGHKEFVKNMVTGASYADAAILVIAADEGVKEQSQQHAHLVSLLGIRQVGVIINKMDCADFSEQRYSKIKKGYSAFLREKGISPSFVIPVNAIEGDNIYRPSKRMRWYDGPTMYEALNSFTYQEQLVHLPLRMVVQDVYKFDGRRIITGRVESGTVKVGDTVLFSPSGKSTQVQSIESWPRSNDKTVASAGESTGITLKEQIFIERGALLSAEKNLPYLADEFSATLFWMKKNPLVVRKDYTLRLGTQEVTCWIIKIKRITRISGATISVGGSHKIQNHEVAEVVIRTKQPIAFDAFSKIHVTGRFVIVDEGIVGGGGIIAADKYPDMRFELAGQIKSKHITRTVGKVSGESRRERYGHKPTVLWLTGLPASGKSTIAIELEKRLFQESIHTYVLDGDNIRHGLNSNLGFSPEDRVENIRRIAEVANLFCDAGLIVITAFISPYESLREAAKRIIGAERFIEIYLDCPLQECEKRDPRGLYKKARAGAIENFTGVSAPYDVPRSPHIKIPTNTLDVKDSVEMIVRYLQENGFLP